MKKDLVFIENNQPLTTSRIVAEQFGKQHKHVVEAIRTLIQQMASQRQSRKLDSAPMFIESTYQAEDGGRHYPMFLMTRDGFSLLAMGFTGKKALHFKLKFIAEFNKMEQKLKSLAVDGHDPRLIHTRPLGKCTRKLFIDAVQALEHYFQVRGTVFPDGYLYGHLTNLIQNALGIEKGGRDFLSVKKLNQLDQSKDLAGNLILRNLSRHGLYSLADIDAQILNQLRTLNNLLSGQLFLPEHLTT